MKRFILALGFILLSALAFAEPPITTGTKCINGYLFAYMLTPNGSGGNDITMVQIFSDSGYYKNDAIRCK